MREGAVLKGKEREFHRVGDTTEKALFLEDTGVSLKPNFMHVYPELNPIIFNRAYSQVIVDRTIDYGCNPE